MRAKGPAIALAAIAVLTIGGAGAAFLADRQSDSSSAATGASGSAPAPTRTQGGRIFLSDADSERATAEYLLPPGTRSILDIRQTLKHGQFHWDADGVESGPLTVRVDVDRQLLSVFRGGHEIGTAVVLFGADGKPTPLGRFPIKDKREDYHSRTYDAPMPYSLWLTDDGVAVHGSNVRDGRATNGCVGLPLDFARLLFAAAQVGDVVEIVASASPAEGRGSS